MLGVPCSMTIYETDFSSGEVRDVRFSTGNDMWADVAVYLSIGIGIFIALFASVAFLMYAKAALAKKEKADAIKQRILDLQIQARTGVKVVRNQTEEEKLNEKSMSPLEQPLELIELLIMNPLRRQMVDSLSTFVRERCKVIQRPSKAELAERAGTMNTDPRTPAKPTAKVAPLTSTSVVQVDGEDDDVTMDEFVEAYSRFCYKLDLREVQGSRPRWSCEDSVSHTRLFAPQIVAAFNSALSWSTTSESRACLSSVCVVCGGRLSMRRLRRAKPLQPTCSRRPFGLRGFPRVPLATHQPTKSSCTSLLKRAAISSAWPRTSARW